MTFVNGSFQAPQTPGSTPAFMQGAAQAPSPLDSRLSTVSSLLGLDNDVLSDPSLTIWWDDPVSQQDRQGLNKAGERVPKARQTTPIDILNNYMSKWSDQQRKNFQIQLYNAGLYPPDYYDPKSLNKPNFGSAMDQGALSALHDVLKNSALTGQSVTSIMGQGSGRNIQALAGLDVGDSGPYRTSTSDPAELRATVDTVAQSLLGRKVDPNERDRLVNQIIGNQSAQQTAANQKDYSLKENAFYNKEGIQNAQNATAVQGSGGSLGAQQIAQSAYNAGFRGDALATITAIALAESGGNPTAHNGNGSTGDDSYGLWQVNYYGDMRGGRTKQYGAPESQFDPDHNAQTAYTISNGGKKFSDWTTYTKGAYKTYLPQAQAAAQAVQAQGGAGAGSTNSSTAGGASYGASTSQPVQDSSIAASMSSADVPSTQAAYMPFSTYNEQQVNPQAEAQESLRAAHPVEAGVSDFTKQFQTFLSMLGKPV